MKYKFSDAMLKGFAATNGKQCKDELFLGDPRKPSRVCVNGAVCFGLTGTANFWVGSAGDELIRWSRSFAVAYGAAPHELNNEGMPWEHLYGMARAAGL
jgi:hypothetical protein